MNKHAPLKKIRGKTQPHPWYNKDIKDARQYRRVCECVGRHTGLQSARIAYKEARNLVNKLIKRTKIQYYRHKLEYADNKDMFNIVNSLIKPKTKSLPNCVCAEEGCNKFGIDEGSSTNITITELVLYKKTLDEFRTCGVNEVSLILKETKKTCALYPLPSCVFTQCIDILTPMITENINSSITPSHVYLSQ